MARQKTSVRRKSLKTRSSLARPVHKKVLLHPYFVFILLCVGVFLSLWTYHANATDIKVSARVAGLPPSVPATIDAPTEGQTFNAMPVTVSGTCPPLSYVAIFSNSISRGIALCNGSNEYSLQITLLPNENELIAHVYNLADEEGPESDPINVFYDVPPPPPSPEPSTPSQPGSNQSSPRPQTEPFLITTEFKVRGYLVGDKVEWPIKAMGGKLPYAVSVDWGDGSSSVYSRSQSGELNVSHQYSSPGPDQGSYTVKITASDANGNSTSLQFFVFVTDTKTLITNGQTGGGILTRNDNILETILSNKWLTAAWPSFGIVLLMVTSFWLGEKEAVWSLRRGPRTR